MRILITAFDPFGGESVNPAREAMGLLPPEIGGSQLLKLEIPTAFGEAAGLVCREMDRLRPDAVISLGQAGGRKAVTPERVAINVADARIADNRGRQPGPGAGSRGARRLLQHPAHQGHGGAHPGGGPGGRGVQLRRHLRVQ